MIQLKVIPEQLAGEEGFEVNTADRDTINRACEAGLLWIDCHLKYTLKEYRTKWPEETYREVLLP